MRRIADHRRGDPGSAVLPQILGILIARAVRVGMGAIVTAVCQEGLAGRRWGREGYERSRVPNRGCGQQDFGNVFRRAALLSCEAVERLS
jgi:hypothetical protein